MACSAIRIKAIDVDLEPVPYLNTGRITGGDIMDLFEAIAARHSYRGAFLDKKIPRADLEKIVLAGIQAPSGCNAQTTSFVIVDDPSLMAKIADLVPRPVVSGAKAVIVCLMETRPVFKCMTFGIEDCAAATENMLLAITALGYATVWLDGVVREDSRAQQLATLLGVPAGKEVRIVLPIGVPKEKCLQRERLPFNERAWFNHYGAKGA